MSDTSTSPAARLLDAALNMEDKQMMDEPNVLSYEQEEISGAKEQILKEQIIEVLRTIYDPEIPVNIYELGLIYDLDVAPDGNVKVRMTLTSPACPVAESLPPEVENSVAAVPGVTNVDLELVWDPPYSIDMMSEAARLDLGLI
jgi:FeS assembly SUF system protein